MSKMNRKGDKSWEEVDIPSEVLTPDEQLVDTSGDVWEMSIRAESTAVLKLNFASSLKAPDVQIDDRGRKLIRLYLAERLRVVKANTVKVDLYAFERFAKWWSEKGQVLKWSEVSESDWRAFRDYSVESLSSTANSFARLRPFYRWGAFQKGFPDFDKDIAASISQIRTPGNEKGEAVRTLDPHRGPLNDTEVKLINDALDDETGTINQRVIVRLLLELGLRPLALTIIRGEHFSTQEVPVAEGGKADKKTLYQLEIPSLKDRGAQISAWDTRPLSTQLGRDLKKVRQSDDQLLLHWLSDYQSPVHKINSTLGDWVRQAGIISPRTGQLLHLFPRRFRRTLATDMAVQGASRAQIAQALGHSDLQNVEVYMDASSTIVDRLKEEGAFDFQDDVIDLFQGRVGDPDEEDVTEQRVPGTAPQVDGLRGITGNIGACQKSSACSLTPPLSCYTCQHFVAFDDAPHADIKNELEAWIQHSPDGVDRRIPQQHVTTVKAIRQLLKQLEDEKTE